VVEGLSEERWFYVGGASADPRVWRVSTRNLAVEELGTVADRGPLGIYALAVAPSGSHVVAGTRPHFDIGGRMVGPALVRAWGAIDTGRPVALWSRFDPAGVNELDFLGDGVVVTASGDGRLRALSVGEGGRLLWELQAHAGPCFALRCVGGVVVSVGADGFCRVWEADGRRASPLSEVSLRPPTGRSAMITLAGDATRGVAWAGDAEGQLWALPLVGAASPRRVVAHRGEVLSVAWLPEEDWLVTGGVEDGELAVWEAESLRLVGRTRTGETIVGLAAVGDSSVVCVSEGRLTLWRAGPIPVGLGPSRALAVRSWTPTPGLAEEGARQRDKTEGALLELIASLHEAANAGTLSSASERLERLRLSCAEEWFLFAALEARAGGRLLRELELWEQAAQEIAPFPPAWAYLAAENREALLDLDRAADRFDQLGGYRDAAARAESCRRHPYPRRSRVRGDVRSEQQLVEEGARQRALGLGWDELLVLREDAQGELSARLDLSDLQRRLEQAGGVTSLEDRALWDGSESHALRWLRLRPSAERTELRGLSLALGGRRDDPRPPSLFCLFDAAAARGGERDFERADACVRDHWRELSRGGPGRAWATEQGGRLITEARRVANLSRATGRY
jgi:hypothetical protein